MPVCNHPRCNHLVVVQGQCGDRQCPRNSMRSHTCVDAADVQAAILQDPFGTVQDEGEAVTLDYVRDRAIRGRFKDDGSYTFEGLALDSPASASMVVDHGRLLAEVRPLADTMMVSGTARRDGGGDGRVSVTANSLYLKCHGEAGAQEAAQLLRDVGEVQWQDGRRFSVQCATNDAESEPGDVSPERRAAAAFLNGGYDSVEVAAEAFGVNGRQVTDFVARDGAGVAVVRSGMPAEEQVRSFGNATFSYVGGGTAVSVATTVNIPDEVAARGQYAVTEYMQQHLNDAVRAAPGVRFDVRVGPERDESVLDDGGSLFD